MAPNDGRVPVCPEQPISKYMLDGCTSKPLSDIELLELFHAVNIREKIAREVATPEFNLQHLVVLCNLCDAISVGEYQLYLERVRAGRRLIRSGASIRAKSNHNPGSGVSDVRPVAPTQRGASVQFRLEKIHLNS